MITLISCCICISVLHFLVVWGTSNRSLALPSSYRAWRGCCHLTFLHFSRFGVFKFWAAGAMDTLVGCHFTRIPTSRMAFAKTREQADRVIQAAAAVKSTSCILPLQSSSSQSCQMTEKVGLSQRLQLPHVSYSSSHYCLPTQPAERIKVCCCTMM